MKITADDVKYIARLAKLRFSDDEVRKLTEEFEGILTHFQSLDKLQLEDVDINSFPEDQKSVVRGDRNVVFEENTKLFQNVKSMRETYIQVPKIIE